MFIVSLMTLIISILNMLCEAIVIPIKQSP